MDRRLVVLICSAAMLGIASIPATAQQKTAKQCNDEWTTNKSSIQASGKTKKAFVAECRGQSTAAPTATPKPAARATPKPPRTAAPTPAANVKTAKQCNDEWTANKATIQGTGKTTCLFVLYCVRIPTHGPRYLVTFSVLHVCRNPHTMRDVQRAESPPADGIERTHLP